MHTPVLAHLSPFGHFTPTEALANALPSGHTSTQSKAHNQRRAQSSTHTSTQCAPFSLWTLHTHKHGLGTVQKVKALSDGDVTARGLLHPYQLNKREMNVKNMNTNVKHMSTN